MKRLAKKIWPQAFVVLAIAAAVTTTAFARETATPREVVQQVKRAARLLVENEPEALRQLRDPMSSFRWKDSYVFVVSCQENTVIANAAFPDRVGTQIKEHVDYAGMHYGLQLCAISELRGSGWLEYSWLPVGGDEPRRKVSFVTNVPGTAYQVGAGIYDDLVSIQSLRKLTEPQDGAP